MTSLISLLLSPLIRHLCPPPPQHIFVNMIDQCLPRFEPVRKNLNVYRNALYEYTSNVKAELKGKLLISLVHYETQLYICLPNNLWYVLYGVSLSNGWHVFWKLILSENILPAGYRSKQLSRFTAKNSWRRRSPGNRPPKAYKWLEGKGRQQLLKVITNFSVTFNNYQP